MEGLAPDSDLCKDASFSSLGHSCCEGIVEKENVRCFHCTALVVLRGLETQPTELVPD